MHNVAKGRVGERIAMKFLQRRGYKVFLHHWVCRWGELDLVALDPSCVLVFVEVKYSTSKVVLPHEQFTYKKRQSLLRTISRFLATESKFRCFKQFDAWRVDLIGITNILGKIEVTHYENV